MQQLYRITKVLNEEEGFLKYAVDHIYPINSPVVCGLHVPWNLRVITREENAKKTNKLPPPGNEIAFPP
jgi:5-methylcytosine-specific restriction endonuclease McrA